MFFQEMSPWPGLLQCERCLVHVLFLRGTHSPGRVRSGSGRNDSSDDTAEPSVPPSFSSVCERHFSILYFPRRTPHAPCPCVRFHQVSSLLGSPRQRQTRTQSTPEEKRQPQHPPPTEDTLFTSPSPPHHLSPTYLPTHLPSPPTPRTRLTFRPSPPPPPPAVRITASRMVPGEHNQSQLNPPTHLPTYPPTHPPTHPPTYLLSPSTPTRPPSTSIKVSQYPNGRK